MPPGDNPLGGRIHQLVGSFFNRHAVEDLRPLRLLVDVWFQVYFTPLAGVLFTFPSRYLFTIDLKKYVALPVSSGRFTQAIRVLSYSRTLTEEVCYFRVRDYYPLGFIFPDDSPNNTLCNSSHVNMALAPYNPCHASMSGLGSSRFARRYSGNTHWYLFLSVLRCFTSRGALLPLKAEVTEGYSAGFSHSDIAGSKLVWQLPDAYRSQTTSFIAFFSQGIHHTPLQNFLLEILRTAFVILRDHASLHDHALSCNCLIRVT